MKRFGQIFSAVCIAVIICIHLVMFFKPFEWQRKAAEKMDYQAFFERLENEKKAAQIANGLDFTFDFDSRLQEEGQ